MKKLSKKTIFLLLLVVAVVGGFFYMSSNQPMPSLSVATVQNREFKSVLSVSGTVTKPDLQEYVVTGTSQVKAVNFKVGDTVKAGDVLVTFDNTSIEDNYKLAAIAYEKTRLSLDEIENDYFKVKEDIRKAQADIEWYKTKMDEWEKDKSVEGITQYNKYWSSWESSKTIKENLEKTIPSDEALKIKQLGYEEARLTLEQAQKTYNEAPKSIVATAGGVIESQSVSKLSSVVKGTIAVAVRPTDSNSISFSIGRYDVEKVKVGQTVDVTVGGTTYKGVVSEIKPIATEKSTLAAKVELEDAKTVIPGLDADLDILIYSSPSVLTIPIESVKTDKTGDYVYLLSLNEDGVTYAPTKTYITLGHSSDLYVEVLGGISEGDSIATNVPSTIEMFSTYDIFPID